MKTKFRGVVQGQNNAVSEKPGDVESYFTIFARRSN
jgi:hypothetical protein